MQRSGIISGTPTTTRYILSQMPEDTTSKPDKDLSSINATGQTDGNQPEPARRESRVKKTLLNARVNMIFYILTLFLSFFSRKIFLDCLGADFIGLTGTMQNLLGFLNLAELGIGTAIGFLLYKPLFNNDRDQINEIISVMGFLYRWIGIIILAGGVILSCFLPLIFPADRAGFSYLIVYLVFYTFLISALIGYFINYKQNLLGADQRNYIVAGYYQGCNIIVVIIQIALAYYTRSYILWILVQFAFSIVYSIILNWKIRQTYPWLRSDVSAGRELLKKHRDVIVKTKQLFIQKISYFVQYQTVPFLTYALVNLQTVAFFGNYTIVTDKLGQFVNTFMESSGASIGNLIAEGNKSKIVNLFWELISMRYLIGGIFSFAVLTLINPFITVWLGKEYLLSNTVLYLIVINMFIGYTRGGVMQFLFGYGMFQDIWAPISEIVINLSIAIVGGSLWGLPGILLGGIVSQILIVGIWKPIFLFRKGFELPVWKYWTRIAKIMICVAIPLYLTYRYLLPIIPLNPADGYASWCAYAIVCCMISGISIFIFLYASESGMRCFMRRFIKIKK